MPRAAANVTLSLPSLPQVTMQTDEVTNVPCGTRWA